MTQTKNKKNKNKKFQQKKSAKIDSKNSHKSNLRKDFNLILFYKEYYHLSVEAWCHDILFNFHPILKLFFLLNSSYFSAPARLV
jgi:hypothetical protein